MSDEKTIGKLLETALHQAGPEDMLDLVIAPQAGARDRLVELLTDRGGRSVRVLGDFVHASLPARQIPRLLQEDAVVAVRPARHHRTHRC